jgi:hypothetical protein
LIGRDVTHKWYYVPIIYAVYCAVAMFALAFIRETRDIDFEALDSLPAQSGPTAVGYRTVVGVGPR